MRRLPHTSSISVFSEERLAGSPRSVSFAFESLPPRYDPSSPNREKAPSGGQIVVLKSPETTHASHANFREIGEGGVRFFGGSYELQNTISK